MQAVDEPVGDGARDELQVPDAREHNGIHEAGARDDVGLYRHLTSRARQRHGLEQRSTIASVVTPSDCAWKFVMMR